MTVVDASALLAFLQGEPGSEEVERALESGTVCGAANWSEVAQLVQTRGQPWDLARALLLSFDLVIEPVTAWDAEQAAVLWVRGSGLSLGDRLCLALGMRLDLEILTADRAWQGRQRVRLIR